MVRSILKIGDPRLESPSADVGLGDLHDVIQWVQDLHETLDHDRRVGARFWGLSGIQIGIAKRICVIWTKDDGYRFMLNPRVTSAGGDPKYFYENCRSIPQLRVAVSRPSWAVVESCDVHLRLTEQKFEELHARLVLHEIDHLDGILCTSRAFPGSVVLTSDDFQRCLAAEPEFAALRNSMDLPTFEAIRARVEHYVGRR